VTVERDFSAGEECDGEWSDLEEGGESDRSDCDIVGGDEAGTATMACKPAGCVISGTLVPQEILMIFVDFFSRVDCRIASLCFISRGWNSAVEAQLNEFAKRGECVITFINQIDYSVLNHGFFEFFRPGKFSHMEAFCVIENMNKSARRETVKKNLLDRLEKFAPNQYRCIVVLSKNEPGVILGKVSDIDAENLICKLVKTQEHGKKMSRKVLGDFMAPMMFLGMRRADAMYFSPHSYEES